MVPASHAVGRHASAMPVAVSRVRLPLLTVAALLAIAAPVAAQDYYADIWPVLATRCASCHTAGGVAWSMDVAEATYARRQQIAAAILGRQMPPWLAEAKHQQYRHDPTLDEKTIELVRRWRDRGFPRGDAPPGASRAADDTGVHAHATFDADISVPVLPSGSYLPNQTRADDYRCFVVDWPGERPQYVTGFRAVPGNRRVAHHLVVYAVAPGLVSRFRELDEMEPGPGYQCFGGALPDRMGNRPDRDAYEARYPGGLRELSAGNFWLAHWAPGMDGHPFPEGTGIRMLPGAGLVVQMHYYGGTAPGERDAGTRMEFRVAEQVDRPALHFSQTNSAWLNGARNGSMVIPPGGTATFETANTLGELLPQIARVTGVPASRVRGLEVHSANLHMHAIGHSGTVSLRDRQGLTQVLLSVPRWDLRWQRDFTFVEPKVFAAEELGATVLSVRCTFRNPKDRPVYGGYGSDDEMCFNFSYIAVRTDDAPPAGKE